jgi:hypothetical protein
MAPTGEWTGFAATTSKGVISPVPIDADEVSILKKKLGANLVWRIVLASELLTSLPSSSPLFGNRSMDKPA